MEERVADTTGILGGLLHCVGTVLCLGADELLCPLNTSSTPSSVTARRSLHSSGLSREAGETEDRLSYQTVQFSLLFVYIKILGSFRKLCTFNVT